MAATLTAGARCRLLEGLVGLGCYAHRLLYHSTYGLYEGTNEGVCGRLLEELVGVGCRAPAT